MVYTGIFVASLLLVDKRLFNFVVLPLLLDSFFSSYVINNSRDFYFQTALRSTVSFIMFFIMPKNLLKLSID